MTEYSFITRTEDLVALCDRLKSADFVAFDTEFMRESTYYPDLCLIQVASPQEAAIIDPKAADLSLAPLYHLLNEEPVLKVVHAAGQDLEIIYWDTGALPTPLFDTQVAAMALGFGDQVGYQALIERLLKIQVAKGARFTDWSRRPLEDRQLDYAIGDVTYLAQAFPLLVKKLKETGRGEWLDEEMARLTDVNTYRVDPEQMWRRIKIPSRNPEVFGRLKALSAWREREAQSKNLPRPRIAKDETLAELAMNPPSTQAHLGRVRGLSSGWATNDIGARLMGPLKLAQPMAAEDIPPRDRGSGLGRQASLIADLLKLLLKIRCEESEIAAKLVCRAEELEALASGVREGLPLLTGWRREMFGNDALALVEGRLAFSVRQGRLHLQPLEVDI